LAAQAPAVTAFYERDPAAVRAAGRMAVFPPDELVCVRVRFTRVLYAQLAQQRFDPPRRWPMPPPAHPEHKAAALGAKLAAGFEMLAAEWARAGVALPLPGAEAATEAAASPQVGPPATMPPPADDDPGWQAFRASLERAGFFAGGADALKRAAAAYGTTAAYARFVAAAAAPAERAAAVLAQAGPLCAEAFGQPPGAEADDPEGWLLEGEALLERALAARDAERAAHEARRASKRTPAAPTADDDQAPAPPDTSAADDTAAAEELGHVARGVRAFVAAKGSMHGASVPDAEAPELQVDPSRFLRELSDALGLDMDELRRGGGDEAGSSSGSGSDTDSSDSTDLSDDFEVDTEDDEDADADAAADGAAEPMDADAAGWRRFRPADDESSDSDDEAATSEDDDDDDAEQQQQRPRGRGGFGAAYSAALDQQLRGTAMATDFARAPAATAASDAAPDDEDEAMRPVDVDLNLVQSLLASYTAQEGLPGPASNMLGLLGLALPDDADRRAAPGE
jgi:hypothetical protein